VKRQRRAAYVHKNVTITFGTSSYQTVFTAANALSEVPKSSDLSLTALPDFHQVPKQVPKVFYGVYWSKGVPL
jgi:hypothetical protein